MKKSEIMLLIIGFIVLTSVFYIRYTNHSVLLIDDSPYYDIILSTSTDNPVGIPDLYIMVLSSISQVIPIEVLLLLFSYMAALFSIYLISKIFSDLKFESSLIFIIGMVMVFSPQFISIFTISIKTGFAFMLLLASYYYLTRSKDWLNLLGTITLCAYSMISVTNIIIALFLLLAIFVLNKKKSYAIFIVPFVYLIFYVPYFIKTGFLCQSIFTNNQIIREFFSDFGGIYGGSVFGFVLASVGSVIAWKKSNKSIFVYLSSIVLIGISFIYRNYSYFSFLIISVFAGYSIYFYYSREWKVDYIKSLTILVIVCGLLFSFLSYSIRQEDILPNSDYIEALDFITDIEEGNILSHYSYGYMSEYFSGYKSVIKSKTCDEQDLDNVLNETNTIFHSRNLGVTLPLLDKYDVRYIIITPEMKQGLVWMDEGEGLQFLFRNKEIFRKIYDSSGYEVWMIIGTDKNV